MARRTALRLFALANRAYRNAEVAFYEVDTSTLTRTQDLATVYDAPTGGNAVANPYTLDSDGRAPDILYTDEAIIAVVNSDDLGQHDTGIIFPQSSAGWRGIWETSVTYLTGEWVKDGPNGSDTGNVYVATEDHTSDSWTTDLSNELWDLIVDVATIEGFTDDAETSKIAAASSAASASSSATSSSSSASSSSASASSSSTSATSSASSATTAAAAAVLSAGFADTTGDTVTGGGGEYSSKEYAIGTLNAHTGSAKGWATTSGATVPGGAGEYSAKDYAIGTVAGIAGSAKAWAITAHSSTVPGGGGEYSAKHYAAESAASAASLDVASLPVIISVYEELF